MIEDELRYQTNILADAYTSLSGRAVSDISIKDFLMLRKVASEEICAEALKNAPVFTEAHNAHLEKPPIVSNSNRSSSLEKTFARPAGNIEAKKEVKTESKPQKSNVTEFKEKKLSPYEELKLLKDEWN